MKCNYISLLHSCENCTITFTPLLSLLYFLLLSTTFADLRTSTVRNSKNGCPQTLSQGLFTSLIYLIAVDVFIGSYMTGSSN